MVATTSLLYRMGIEGDEQVKAAIASIGDADEKMIARAIAASDRRAERVGQIERMLAGAKAASAKSDERTLALITGNTAAYEAQARAVGLVTQAQAAATAVQGRAAASTGQLRAASQQLSYQIGDIAQGFALGTPIMTIFAQQAGQTVQALQLMTNSTKGFLGVMATGWGAVIIGSVTILTTLGAKLLQNNNALDAEVDKLKKSADQTEISRRAHDLFEQTIEGVRQALQDARDADQKWIESQRTAAEQAAINARANVLEEESIRSKTKARLDDQIANLKLLQQSARGPGANGETAQFQTTYAQQSILFLQGQVALEDTAIKARQKVLADALADLALEQAKTALDPIASIKKKYEGSGGLIDQKRQALQLDNASLGVMRAQLAVLLGQEQAEIAAEEKRQSTARQIANDNRQTGRQISLPEAEQIVKSIGGTITSATRSFEKQTDLYNKYLAGAGPLAAKPGHSDHETGHALDIAKTPGMSLAKIREAFTAQGVAIKQLLDEGNHFHVAWKAGADEAAKAEKQLADIVSGLQAKFDPAAKAATDYAKALADIAKAHLDPATAAAYAEAAHVAFVKARAAAFVLPGVEEYRGAYDQQDEADKRAQRDADRAGQRAQTILTDQNAALGYAREELGITTLNNNQRNIELARLAAIQELERAKIPLENAYGKQIIANAESLETLRQKQDLVNASIEEAQRFGDQFLSDVLDPRNWDDWGEAGKRIVQDLESEFIKLALLNPLKNFLFGEANPTLGSIGGIIGGLFGHNASGTEYWGGGPTWVAENGPELIDLPRGARVTPANDTRRILAQNDNQSQRVDLRITLSEDLDARIDNRSAAVSVAVTREAAPQIVKAASDHTLARLSRPTI